MDYSKNTIDTSDDLSVEEMEEIKRKAENKSRMLVPSKVQKAFARNREQDKAPSHLLMQYTDLQIRHANLQMQAARTQDKYTNTFNMLRSQIQKLKNVKDDLKNKKREFENFKKTRSETKLEEEVYSLKMELKRKTEKDSKMNNKIAILETLLNDERSFAKSDKKSLQEHIELIEDQKSALDRVVSKKSVEIKHLRHENKILICIMISSFMIIALLAAHYFKKINL